MSNKKVPNLPPTPKLGTGYYVFGDSVLVHISGIIFDHLIKDWVYCMEIVADKTKSLSTDSISPIVTDLDRILPSLDPKRIESKNGVKTLEVLFSASEPASAWESSLNEEPIVSEAESNGEDDDV